MVIRFRVSPPLRPTRANHPGTTRHHSVTALVAAAALLLLALGAPIPAFAASRVHYMSTTGNDAWAGTGSRPWHTLYASLRKLHAGDTLYIRGGSYGFSGVHWTGVAGTSTRPILISNYPGETPIFVGSGAPADWLYFDGNAAWVTLRGLWSRAAATCPAPRAPR